MTSDWRGFAPVSRRHAPSTRRAMNKPNPILEVVSRILKQLWQLPRSIATAITHRRRQVTIRENETERLDRILNPAKYRGK